MPLVKMSEINKKKESTPTGLIPMGSLTQDSQEEQTPQIKSPPTNFLNIETSPLMQRINETKQQNNSDDFRTDYPGGLWNPLNDLGHLANSSIVRSLDNAAGKAMGIPSDLMKTAKPTGSNALDTTLNFIGQGAGYLTNPAQIEQNVGKVFFDNPLVNKASGKVAGLVDNGLAKLTGSNVAQTLEGRVANRMAEGATSGAIGAASYAPFQTLNSGGDVQDIPHNVLEQGLMGGAFGAAGGAAGSLIKSGLKSMKEIVGGAKEAPLPDYSNIQVSSGRGKNNPIVAEPKNTVLHSDPFKGDPIRLTPQEISRNERIEKFSQQTDNLGDLPDTIGQIQSKTIVEKPLLAQRANDLYIKGVDNLHRVNQFDKKVAEVTGKELKPSESSYTLGLNSRGSDMISRQILEKNLVDSQGNVIGNSLKDVAQSIPKGKEAQFNDYIVAKHSISRMGRGEKVYKDDLDMTIQKADAKVKEYERTHPEFKQAADKYYEYNRKLGQAWLVDTGLLSQKQWDSYLEANPNYVPNQRIFSDLEKGKKFGSKGGFADQTSPIKTAVGSQRQIVNPIESTIENTAKYVKTAKQNEVMQMLYKNIQKDPDKFKDWAEIVGKNADDSSKILDEHGPEGLVDEVAKSFDSALNKPDLTKGNIVSAFVDGERVHLKVNDPQLLEAITSLSPQGQHFVMDAIGRVTKTMKVLTTGVNPVFGITRNIARDIPTAFVNSKTTNNPIKFGIDLLDSVMSVMADTASGSKLSGKLPDYMQSWLKKKGELYNTYKNVGGGHSSSVAADRNLLAQSKESLIPSSSVRETLKRNLLTKPYHALENLNNTLEVAPRLSEFKRLSKEGTYDSKVKGLFEANDVTTNFNKFGNNTKQADALFPYLNAAVQGLDKTIRVIKDNPVQSTAKAAAAVTIPTILMYALNYNNPDYQKLSNFVKDNNFLIPKGDGTFLKVPKARELGMMFSTPLERILRSWNEDDPKAFQDFAHNFIQNMSPPGIGGAIEGLESKGVTGILPGMIGDTIAGPIQSLASNKDFTNRPIVPQDLAQLSPRLQYDDKTSEPAKFLGNLLNTSPKQLDYLTKSYAGVLGQLGIPLTTKTGSIADTLKTQVTADPAYSNDISRNFYDEKAKYDMKKADAKSQGNVSEDAGLTKYFTKVATQISRIRKLMDYVQNDDSITKADKKAQLRDLQIQISDLQKQSLEQLQATR